MAYATLQQLLDEYGANELAQVADESALVDGELLALTVSGGSRAAYSAEQIAAADTVAVRLTNALNRSTGEIDGYVGVAYALPITPVPDTLVALNLVMARFRLYDDRAPAEVRARYDDAVRFLRDLAAGRASLGIQQDDAAAQDIGSVEVSHSTDDRLFTMDTLAGF